MKWIGMLAVAVMCISCGKSTDDSARGTGGTVDPAAEPPAAAPAPADAPPPAATPAPSVQPAPARPNRPAGENRATAEAPVAEAPRPVEPARPAAPVYRDITLPAGTTLRLELQTAVASDTSAVEDAVRATLRQGIEVDGREVLPAGTELAGTVTEVDRAARVKGRARVAYRFGTLNHQGERYDVSTAVIAHEAESTTRDDATKIAIGAGAGAAIGAILGGGDGAAKGAAIGGASGTGAVLATRGKEVRLGRGADVTTRLTAPLTIRVRL